jgi:hypothetical protein
MPASVGVAIICDGEHVAVIRAAGGSIADMEIVAPIHDVADVLRICA